MGWEKRGGKLVYYRKERYKDEAGRSRVRSIHFGSGAEAEAAAREDEERRASPSGTPEKEACATAGVTNIRDLKKETALAPPDLAQVSAKKEEPITRAEIAERAARRSGSGALADYFAGCGLVDRALEMAGLSASDAQRRGLAL